MNHYSEPVLYGLNRQGKRRLTSVLSTLPGALHHGFDGDGTPKGATVRLWRFAKALTEPLPDGVVEMPVGKFEKAVADREAAKPRPLVSPPPDPGEAPLTKAENKALRKLLSAR
jgi:hypothetical protein